VVLVPQGKERREDGFAYATATTDEAGKFAIGNIAPGEYRVFAWAFGMESRRRMPYMDPEFVGRQESKGTVLALDTKALRRTSN
jgi:hypothetical protein